MSNGDRDWASRLGSAVRGLIVLLRVAMFVAGFVLVIRGLWLFDASVAYVGAGLFILFFFWPRPDRRT